MPRSEKTQAAQTIVSEASAALNLDLVEELAQPLAKYLLDDYGAEDWQRSPWLRPWRASLPCWR